MNIYITPEHYARAEAIGVSRELLNMRVRQCFWEIERAVTTPRKERKEPSPWLAVAKKNGINQGMFYSRVHGLKWSEEKAATTSREDAEEGRVSKRRLVSPEERKRAEETGISVGTVIHRLHRGWSREAALTTPPTPPAERARRGREMAKLSGGRSQ